MPQIKLFLLPKNVYLFCSFVANSSTQLKTMTKLSISMSYMYIVFLLKTIHASYDQ